MSFLADVIGRRTNSSFNTLLPNQESVVRKEIASGRVIEGPYWGEVYRWAKEADLPDGSIIRQVRDGGDYCLVAFVGMSVAEATVIHALLSGMERYEAWVEARSCGAEKSTLAEAAQRILGEEDEMALEWLGYATDPEDDY